MIHVDGAGVCPRLAIGIVGQLFHFGAGLVRDDITASQIIRLVVINLAGADRLERNPLTSRKDIFAAGTPSALVELADVDGGNPPLYHR